jgi:hypothetical protein
MAVSLSLVQREISATEVRLDLDLDQMIRIGETCDLDHGRNRA